MARPMIARALKKTANGSTANIDAICAVCPTLGSNASAAKPSPISAT